MYHYADSDVPRGPVPKEELRGRITAQTLVWREGMADWLPAGTLPELADLFGSRTATPGPVPVVAAVPPDAWTGNAQATAPVATAIGPVAALPPAEIVDYQNNPGYGQPPGTAVAAMVLGIVGLVLMCAYFIGIIPAILAVVFGYVARGQGATGNNPGAGMATAGIIMGWVPIALFVVLMVLLILVMIVTAFAH